MVTFDGLLPYTESKRRVDYRVGAMDPLRKQLGFASEWPTSARKAWSPGQMHSKTGFLRRAFLVRIRHPVNRNGDHHRLCQGRTHRHCAMDRLATAHVPSDPLDATTQPCRFK